MKWRALALGIGGAGALVVLVMFTTIRGPLAPVQVTTAEVREAPLKLSVFGIGTVEARRSYSIGPTQPGRVLKVNVDHGDRVKAGQTLAEMDPVDLRERLEAAESGLQRANKAVLVARAQKREAQSRSKVALANAVRYRDLARSNFVSGEVADVKQSEANIARAALDGTQGALQAALSDVAKAAQERDALLKQLSNLALVSPAEGIIIAREAEPGNTVVAGQAVLRMIDPASLWVQARIDQSRASGIKPGQAVDIVLRSAPNTPLPGRVARVEIQSDSVTEERIVDVTFTDAHRDLGVGELAEVTIRHSEIEQAVVVPSAAVKRVRHQQGVWQVNGGKTVFKPVKIGAQTLDGESQVLEGLRPGEHVIVHSSAQLQEGIKVKVGKPS